MRSRGTHLLMYLLGGTLVLAQRHALGAEPPRLRMADGLTMIALADMADAQPREAERSNPAATDAPLSLQLSTDPQNFPEDEDEIPDLTRSVLPERERRSTEPEAVTGKNRGDSPVSRKGLFGMTLAPLRWGGYTQDIFRMTKNSAGSQNLSHSQQLDLRAASYLWQPWFATINGNIGIGRGVQGSGNDNESKTDSISGSGDLTLFPQSRFPFTASFSVSDSSTSTDLIDNGTQQTRYSLRQQYRPKKGNALFSLVYDNNTVSTMREPDTLLESLRGTYTDQIGKHNFMVDAHRTESSRPYEEETLVLNSANASHTWSPGPRLSLSNSLSVSTSETSRVQGLQSTQRDVSSSRSIQGGASVSWQPKESLPLNFSGGINLFRAESETNGDPSESQSINGNLGVSYFHTFSRNLSASLGANMMVVDAQTDEFHSRIIYLTENGTANYVGDPLAFGNFSYNWNLNSSFINQAIKSDGIEGAGTTQSYTAGASHNINRNWTLWEKSTLNFGANQSVTMRWGSVGERNGTLSSGVNLGWTVIPLESMNASISLSASDTRQMGEQVTDSQFVNLQGNLNLSLSSYSNLSANASIQWNRQGAIETTESGTPASTSLYGNASLNYQNYRAFRINNLQYTLSASFNMQQNDDSLLGDSASRAEPFGYSLDQRLTYRLGRIDMGATATYTYQGGKENALLYLHMGRTFGNY